MTSNHARLRRCLIPLVLALAVQQAYAVDVVYYGRAGAAGAAGVDGGAPGLNGKDGAAAGPVSFVLASFGDPGSILTLYCGGGVGGHGGDGVDALSLEISNNGTLLFAQSFGSLADASLFLGSGALDLGVFGPGRQDLLLSAYLQGGGGYTLNGDFAAAVPEPGQWLMLLAGLGLLLAAARRRGAGAAR